MVTGEIEKSIQTYTLWAQSYPADDIPANNLGFDYSLIGQLDKALTQTQESLRLTPNSVIGYGNVMGIYLAPNRLDEAKAAFDKAIALKLDGPGLRITRYQLAFFQNDETAMQEQAAWVLAKPSVQDQMLTALSDSEAYHGRLTKHANSRNARWKQPNTMVLRRRQRSGRSMRRCARPSSGMQLKRAKPWRKRWR